MKIIVIKKNGFRHERDYNPESPVRRMARKLRIGDVVEKAASPVAKVLRVKNCSGCQKRKAWLNGE